MPEGIEKASICKKSGKLAVKGLCDADPRGSQIITEYFAKGTAPKDKCDTHYAVEVCAENGKKASVTCTKKTKVCIKRPKGSEGHTDDSDYTAPTETCPGHTIIDKVKGLINGKGDPKIPDASTKNNTGGSQGGRAEEDGDKPPVGDVSSDSDTNDKDNPANAD